VEAPCDESRWARCSPDEFACGRDSEELDGREGLLLLDVRLWDSSELPGFF